MHLLLTDRLTCPRCGPTFGLILLSTQMEERVVREGRLGCPNCRDAFPIEGGFADLRAPPRGEPTDGLAGEPGPDSTEEAEKVAALLGIVGGPGTVSLVGEPARHAAGVAAASDELLVVAVDPDLRSWPESPGVSRLMSAPGLPFFDGSLRGVALDGRLGRAWLEEAARVVAPRGRVVVVHAAEDAAGALVEAGLEVLASEAERVVATRG